MNRVCSHLAFIVALATASASATAQDFWFGRLAIETGGDELLEVTFVDGSDDDIEAGGFFHIEVGRQFVFVPSNSNLITEISLGYKTDSVNATTSSGGDADFRFSRFTLLALQYFQVSEKLKVGGGLTYHINPTLSAEVNGADADLDFDNGFGFMFGADYLFTELFSVGVRGTQIDYKVEGNEVSGNSFGVQFTRYF